MKTTVHLIYPHGSKASCPDAIGRHLAARLRSRYDVRLYDWQAFGKIQPGGNDVLVGHACPVYFTVFRRSCRAKGWKRVLLLSPYCHGDDHQPAFNEALVRHCDLYLAITGGYWFADIEKSGYKHWLPKMRHLDLAIDRAEFPSIKRSFNPVGRRRIVYIGSDAWYKNTRYLAAIAESMPETEFGWIGTDRSVGNIEGLGHRSLTTAEGRALVSGYDILLTVGKADGNPATILEAMAWGLIPVCTPQSGYVGFQSILNVPINDTAGAVQVLWSLLVEPEARLREIQEQNWRLLDEYFNWDRFAAQVVAAIESEEAPACVPVSIGRRLELLFAEIFNPFWANLLDPRKMRKRLRKIQVV